MNRNCDHERRAINYWMFQLTFCTLLFFVMVGLYGCGGGGGSSSSDPKTLASISIQPANNELAVGKSQQFTAVGAYSDGSSKYLTSDVTWSLVSTTEPSATVVEITSGGMVKAMAPGKISIKATLGDMVDTLEVTIVPVKILASISITPAINQLAVGKSQQFEAVGSYSDGSPPQDLTSMVIWSSSSSNVITITPGGMVTAVTLGTTIIKAALGDVAGTTSLEVTTLPVTTTPVKLLASISITPAINQLAVGKSQQFEAKGTYSDGSSPEAPILGVTWSSTPAGLITITSTGIVTAEAPGTTIIKAALGDVVGTTSLIVPVPGPVIIPVPNPTVPDANVTGIWEGTYTIYEAVDKSEVEPVHKTYKLKFYDLVQNGTSVTGKTILRDGLLEANGQFTIANVSGNVFDFEFKYNDPKNSFEMMDKGTAKITDNSMSGNVIENSKIGYNCSFSFTLKKQP